MKIGIIGAGWYGCHLACALKKAGFQITLFEKNHDIFQQISGKFGIRLHAGPHYPRSIETRKSCRRGFDEFIKSYPELVVEHSYSIYGLGRHDANNEPSRVNLDQFRLVCEESDPCRRIDPSSWGYQELISAMDIQEPSIAVGTRLRETFRRYLREHEINIICNFEVANIKKEGAQFTLSNGKVAETFDYVINATSYQSFLPQEKPPFDMEVVYQPCLALVYEDTYPTERPFSFIVMDGWYPCLMPYCDEFTENQSVKAGRKYILTHGKWTIMGSYSTAAEAKKLLNSLDDSFIEDQIKPPSESEMHRFWPDFSKRFRYRGEWKGVVLAKLKTKKEFRSAVTFAKEGIIHIIPGKVSNIFDAEKEVLAYLYRKDILSHHGFEYVRGGVLADALSEISEKPQEGEPNTCTLRTFEELQQTQLFLLPPHLSKAEMPQGNRINRT